MNKTYVVSIGENLTSYAFYKTVIPQLHDYFTNESDAKIVFDFSNTRGIDALVLPNLLCTGFWITKHLGTPAKLFIPDNLGFSHIRAFLNNSHFIEFARKYNLFEFDNSILGDADLSKMGHSLNRMQMFQIDNSIESDLAIEQAKLETWDQLKRSFLPFIETFLKRAQDKAILLNKDLISFRLLSFMRELVENALFHGRSFCFLSVQYISSYKPLIKISVSDCGIGFRDSINWDRRRSLEILNLLKEQSNATEHEKRGLVEKINLVQNEGLSLNNDDVCRLSAQPFLETELEGIVYGLLSRNQKPYGLYSVHKMISSMNGTIRIHSNDTQLILSPKMELPLEIGITPQDLLRILENDKLVNTYNVRRNLKFKGVHIELVFELGSSKVG